MLNMVKEDTMIYFELLWIVLVFIALPCFGSYVMGRRVGVKKGRLQIIDKIAQRKTIEETA